MDLITSFPQSDTVFIGLFMLNNILSGQGIGSKIIKDVLEHLRFNGFSKVRLGYMKGNPQSKAFWEKCGFVDIGIETENGYGKVVILEKIIIS